MSGVFASRQQGFIRPLAEAIAARRSTTAIATLARCRVRRARRAGRAGGRRQLAADAAHPLRRHRHDAAGQFHHALDRRGARAFEAAHKAQFGFIYHGQAAGHRDGRGRRARTAASPAATRRIQRSTRRRNRLAAESRKLFCGGEWRDAGGLPPRGAEARPEDLRPGADHREPPDHRRRARLAARDHRQGPRAAAPHREEAPAGRARHRGRSGHARSLQQPLHVDRRADGRDAAEHGLIR